jgi:hypothetical protein
MNPVTKSLARVAAAAIGRLAGGRAVILLGLRPPPDPGGGDRRTENSVLKIELNFRR